MVWAKDFSFWVMLVKNLGAAGNLACLIGIVIFGSAVLEDYDTFDCKIGAGKGVDGTNAHGYKLGTQLLFIFTIVASFMYAPHNYKGDKWRYGFAVLLSMGLVMSAFMAGYAGITANCVTSGIINGTEARFNMTINATSIAESTLEKLETAGSKSMAASFLSFGALLGIATHDLFDKNGNIHFAISHWPAWLDTIMRLVAFSMIAHFLSDDANYDTSSGNNTTEQNSAQCIFELNKLKDADHGDIIPYKHDRMEKLALAVAIMAGIELCGKAVEFFMYRAKTADVRIKMLAYTNRALTIFSRVCVGIFVFGFILANELLICQPYAIDTYFRVMIGILLSCYFSGVLQTMLVGHGNLLVLWGEGPSIAMGENKYGVEMSNMGDTTNPLLIGF